MLALVLLSGGAVMAQPWLRPSGLTPSAPRAQDDTAINHLVFWPRPLGAFEPWVRTADLRFPRGTEAVYGTWVTAGDPRTRVVHNWLFPVESAARYLKPEAQAAASYARSSLKRPFRLVVAAGPSVDGRCSRDDFEIGALLYTRASAQLPSGSMPTATGGVHLVRDLFSGWCAAQPGNMLTLRPGDLALNRWNLIAEVAGGRSGMLGYALLLYPANRQEVPQEPTVRFDPEDRHWDIQ